MQELINLKEASKMLGVKPETLRKWDNSGKLKAVRIGSRKDRRYEKSQIQAILGQSDPDKYEIQEMDGSSHIFFGYINGFLIGLKNNFGKSITKHIFVTQNGHMKIAYPHQELLDLGEFLTNKLIKDTSLMDKTINEFNYYLKETERLIDLLQSKNINKKELLEIFKYAEEIYEKGMSWSMIIEPLDIYLIKKIKENLDIPVDKFSEFFGALTSPLEESFVLKEKREILEILKDIEKDESLKNIFVKSQAGEIEVKIKDLKIIEKINKHVEQYIWINGDYIRSTPLEFIDVIKSIKEYLNNNVKIAQELSEIDNYVKDLKIKKDEILKAININEEMKNILALTEKIGGMHDWRKEAFLKSQFLFELLFKNISRKNKINIEVLRFSLPEEIFNYLKNNKIDKEKILERKKYSLVLSGLNGHKIYYNKEALEIESKELSFGDKEVFSLIKGIPASLGKIVGRAVVAYSSDEAIKKIQKGDILITSMTRPDFVPAMKIAGAIVTNEGGITCHASIVSREFKIPCVVGTRIATKIINDGDIVEVNGNHGIVYIVKKGE